MSEIKNLEPKEIWNYFHEITQVPRPSKKEEKIRNYVKEVCNRHGVNYKEDGIGNIIATKEATPGFENKPTIVLQSHLDMVCEKNNDTTHDFDNDPIKTFIDGEWVKAQGTTLGGDNGIGIAAQLAVLTSKTLKHGKVECLFTVDEETGLTGAFALEKDAFTGKILLNLDSEDDGELFIGCAGGMDTRIQYSYDTQKSSPGSIAYEINVTGLAGGHSGDEIHKGLGNANKIISRFLYDIDALYPFSLASIRGGNLRNAIPREASAVITIEKEHEEVILSYLNKFAVTIREELKTADPKVMINFKQVEAPKKVFKKGHTRKLLKALQVCPNGVIRMSDDIPGLVETSTNLASIKNIDDNTLEIVTSQRSSIVSRKKEISKRVAATFDLIGAEIIHESPYPGWKPNLDSKILAVTEKSYKKLFKEDAKVKAIHAGLECGLFLEKYPDLDMISFGPTIRGAHSPDERMHIPAVEKFWKLLVDVLEEVE